MIETVDFSQIIPGEADMGERHLARVIYFREQGVELLPVSVKEYDGKLYQLQGRHRLIYAKLAGEQPIVRRMKSPEDIIQYQEFPGIDKEIIKAENKHLVRRFPFVQNYNEWGAKDFNHFFEMLREKYSFLENMELCKQYLETTGALPYVRKYGHLHERMDEV